MVWCPYLLNHLIFFNETCMNIMPLETVPSSFLILCAMTRVCACACARPSRTSLYNKQPFFAMLIGIWFGFCLQTCIADTGWLKQVLHYLTRKNGPKHRYKRIDRDMSFWLLEASSWRLLKVRLPSWLTCGFMDTHVYRHINFSDSWWLALFLILR